VAQPTAADAAAWSAAAESVGTGREQLAYLLEQPDALARISRRFGNLTPEQRQGHVFEWMHEISFNLDAIANDDSTRQRVTTWLGEPHAPADLRLYDPSGNVLAEAQAKVISDNARRIAGDHGLSSSKYDGMNLLVPADHLAPTDDLMQTRLAMPEGPLHPRYGDVRDRVTDHLRHGSTSSHPVSTEELRIVAGDPSAHLRGLLRDVELDQVLVAGGTAAVMAALVSTVTSSAISAVRSGSFVGIPWTSVASQAARSGAIAGVTALGAQGISLAAQHAVASGATGAVEALAGGTLPFAMTRGAWSIAGATHGWATGRLGPAEAATASVEAVARTGAIWACGAVGQAVIPIPVVGALVGGMVGQYAVSMTVQGLRVALAGRDASAHWNREYELLLAETDRLEQLAQAELARLDVLAAEYRSVFGERVLPELHALRQTLWCSDPDTALRSLAELTLAYAGTPMFTTVAEFDDFMADDSTTLVLHLAGTHSGRVGSGS